MEFGTQRQSLSELYLIRISLPKPHHDCWGGARPPNRTWDEFLPHTARTEDRGKLRRDGGYCRSLCSARTPDHLCTPILSRPKWNGSISYAVPRPEFPRLLLSARNPANTTLRSSPSFYAATGFPGLAFWEARSHRAPGPAGLPAVVEIPPFPGKKRVGWMRDLLHEERYGRR